MTTITEPSANLNNTKALVVRARNNSYQNNSTLNQRSGREYCKSRNVTRLVSILVQMGESCSRWLLLRMITVALATLGIVGMSWRPLYTWLGRVGQEKVQVRAQ
eukprot:948620-Amphidinium_carterae.1